MRSNVNVLNKVKAEMKKHIVWLKSEKKSGRHGREVLEEMYLLEIHNKADVKEEFYAIFSDKLQALEKKVAEQVFSGKLEMAVYGVFLDSDFTLRFAFNREFADYNFKDKKVELKDPGVILANRLSKKAPISELEPWPSQFKPFRRDGRTNPGLIVLKYATPGPSDPKK